LSIDGENFEPRRIGIVEVFEVLGEFSVEDIIMDVPFLREGKSEIRKD
jgi:hypothetical protein